jgi:ABC-type lipoprotein export system ATPase subunit
MWYFSWRTVSLLSEDIIVCEDLVKIYKTKDLEVLALQGLELSVAKGELMAIIGNSGSGKSTFLNMIGGLDRPSAGKLTVDGKDLFKLSPQELVEYKRSTVGFVWQNNARNLVPYLTAIQNIQLPMLFGDGRKRRERALELLELVGMSGKENHRLDQLSGGEQQRIAIAIALANNPKILLADEPTGSVDVKTGNYLLDVFRELNKNMGLTIVIVTHDRMLAKKVNRVVAIRDGKTSSEMVMKQSYKDRLDAIEMYDEVHNEYAVLDKAGRVQIPRELLDQIHVKGNRVSLELADGKIIVGAPEEL